MNPERSRQFAALRLPEPFLWAPGPHALTPAVRECLRSYRATFSHRSAEFRACYREAADLLREIFHIPEGFTPLIFGHTGSYNWEMVAANTPPRFRTLGLDVGAFSKKWAEVFQGHGRHVDVLHADWGKGIAPDAWRSALEKGCDLALLTHNETSTGVVLPVEAMAAEARRTAPEALIAVDGVSIAGAVDIRIDALRPDYYLWSLQKDFAMPAIGSVMVVSDRAIETARQIPHRGYVLDLLEWTERGADAQTPMTVPDLTLRCLTARLKEMRAEGDRRFERHRNLATIQREWAQQHGLQVMAEPGFESPTVTAIALPDHIPGSAFVAVAYDLLNVQLASGYGPTRDRAFRIAAMGHTAEETMSRVLEGLSLILLNWTEVKPL